jgi:hypothetical protein
LKLWLLDADVIIDLLSLSLFDKLIKNHTVFAGSTVIGEVKSFKRSNVSQSIDLRQKYIENGLIRELSASIEEIKKSSVNFLKIIVMPFIPVNLSH